MIKKTFMLFVLAVVFSLYYGFAFAQDQERARDTVQDRLQTADRIEGSQYMTQEERNEYREKINSAKTNEERERIRTEQRERIQEKMENREAIRQEPPPSGGMGGKMGIGNGGGRGVGGRGR